MTTSKSRLTFIPVFLTLLTVAFTVALAMRIRSYQALDAAAQPATRAADGGPDSPGAAGRAEARPADDGTLPDGLKPVAGKPVIVVAQPVSREQRYRELLALGNSPQDAAVKTAAETQAAAAKQIAAKPQPQPQSSAISRLLQPLVNAVTGGQHGGTAPMGPQHTPQPTPPNSDTPRKSDEPKDPNSDTTPPQLIGIEFQPPQIQDGGETTLIITARDDMSGIRGISGTLTSPTGKALQGFAQQRDGETDRYISRISIPKDAEEGIWKISFLNLSDNATNMTTLTYAAGTIPPNAVLKVVSSGSDNTPPTLRGASLARRAMHSGETNSLFIEADDDKSGVRLISAVFVSPSKAARLGFGCKQPGDGSLTWECSISVPECLDCGDWQLEQVQMQDKANNYATIRQDNPIVNSVRLNIAGNSCDSTPPVLQSLMLDKNVVVIGQGDPSVTIRVSVTDDMCGVGGLSGQVVGPGTNAGTFFAFSPEGGQDATSWVGTVRLSPQAPRGIWRIQSITVNDKGQNLRIYYASDAVLARGQFVVK